MSAPGAEYIVTNPRWDGARPALSVVTPFLRDDATPLIEALGRKPGAAELIVLDDGTNNPALAAKIAAAIEAYPGPARFIRSTINLGRSAGRNRLVAEARAQHILFLDADMLPDDEGFLERYSKLIAEKNPAVAFGGFSDTHAPAARETALHRALGRTSDCRSAEERALDPGKTICTSNLLVRRDVLQAIPFDESFKGWGWEDVDWGLRAAARFDVLHIDNPATHLGLETADQLLDKFARSGGNFARLAELHPAEISNFPSYRAAAMMARAPALRRVRPLLAAIARDRAGLAPMALRLAALKLFRASHYADHIAPQIIPGAGPDQ
jgi:glycosyltransferase involved in cell wall biosynthesis